MFIASFQDMWFPNIFYQQNTLLDRKLERLTHEPGDNERGKCTDNFHAAADILFRRHGAGELFPGAGQSEKFELALFDSRRKITSKLYACSL